MNCAVKAYDGKEPFIFISYAHSDAHLVYPIVERLALDGYRVWYDDGIHVGEDWTEAVAQRLDDSSVCVAMLSENSVASVNCRNELAYSLSEGKTLIGVKLTDFEMPRGLKLQLGNITYMERFRYGESEFYERFDTSAGVSGCRAESPRITEEQLKAWHDRWANAAPVKRDRGEPRKVSLTAPAPAAHASKKPLILVGVAALLVLAVLAVVLLPRLSKGTAEPEAPAVTEELEPTPEPEPTAAPVILESSAMDVLEYDSSPGFELSGVDCNLVGSGQTAELEITLNWEDNQKVNAVTCFLNQTVPIQSGRIAQFQKDYYKMTGSPLWTEGEIAPSHTAYYGNVPAQGPIYLLLFCFDEDGTIIAYVTVDVDYPQEGEA